MRMSLLACQALRAVTSHGVIALNRAACRRYSRSRATAFRALLHPRAFVPPAPVGTDNPQSARPAALEPSVVDDVHLKCRHAHRAPPTSNSPCCPIRAIDATSVRTRISPETLDRSSRFAKQLGHFSRHDRVGSRSLTRLLHRYSMVQCREREETSRGSDVALSAQPFACMVDTHAFERIRCMRPVYRAERWPVPNVESAPRPCQFLQVQTRRCSTRNS